MLVAHSSREERLILPGRCQGRYLIVSRIIQEIRNMLRVIVNDGDKIERAIKQFKRKCNDTKLVRELRDRKEFQKPSVIARRQRLRAEYIQKLRNEED